MDSSILDKWDAVHARIHRWRWWTRLVMAAIILPLFWQFARSRMYTPPADPNALAAWNWSGNAPTGCPGVFAAIAKIPPLPALPALPPAPPGQHWEPTQANGASLPKASIDPVEALNGPWTPQARHHLPAIIEYIETPALQAALDEVAREAVEAAPAAGGVVNPLAQFRSTAKLLCVRIRYSLMQRHDATAAARDIRRILDLCALLEKGGTLIQYLVAMAIRSLVYAELTEDSREVPLTRLQLQDLVAALQSRPFDLKASWRSANHAEGRYTTSVLDTCYTKDASGDGWFIPYAPQSDDLAEKVHSCLNVLSPVVNDRRTVLNKIQFVVDRANRACDMPFREGVAQLGGEPESSGFGNPADGPGGSTIDWSHTRNMYGMFARCMASESAATTSMALSAYRAEHGRYPAGLSDLMPQYLASLPIDPVTGGPLCYRLDERDGYSLYSPGDDSIDDGGRLRDADGKSVDPYDGPDWLFSGLNRYDGGVEWYLVPDDTGQQSATTRPE
jgi:hypothetical protein